MTPVTPPEGPLFDHVRGLLRRLILARAEWLPEVKDGPSGEALVRFLRHEGPPPHVAAALDELDARLGRRPPDGLDALEARLRALATRLDLDRVATEFLLVVLAPEIDERFLAAYRLLWGHPEQRYCDEDFVAAVLRSGSVAALRRHLPDDHVLHRLGLVWRRRGAELGANSYRVDDRLLLDLLDRPALPDALTGVATFAPPPPPDAPLDLWADFPLLEATRDALTPPRPFTFLDGSALDAVPTLIRLIAAREGLGCLTLDLARLCDPPATPPLLAADALLLRAGLREARLRGAALVFEGVDALETLPAGLVTVFTDLVAREPGPIYLVCARRPGPELQSRLLDALAPAFLAVTPPDAAARAALWDHALARRALHPSDATRQRLAAQALGPDAIARAVDVALATDRPLDQVAGELTRARLGGLATRVPPALDWADLIFPDRLRDELEDVATFARHRHLIADTWGLVRSTGGQGVKVLLSGPPGTGKTAVSALLAREAGCELYRVDTAAVVSKWLGETEKHLTALFDLARDLAVALLFDEADSLFARRTEVQSSVDRYANQSVNHLLQLIEDHPGVILLTTNNDQVMDTAFARRLTFHLKFAHPGTDERVLLWRAHLPPTVPLDDDVDLDWLATHYELTGGQVRQAALRAAVSALRAGRRALAHDDLEVGARAIYAAAGRLPPQSLRDSRY